MSEQIQEISNSDKPAGAKPTGRVNFTVVAVCLTIVGGMTGLSFAAVPLYRIFCQVTGYGGTTQKAEGYKGKVLNKTITVSFDSNISRELDWKFQPKIRSIDVKLGEKVTAYFIARNIGKGKSTGEALFNVSPQAAGQYFNKIECFCFTEQTLKPGETAEMPVLFFIDPAIKDDPLLQATTTITLSYTFFPLGKSDEADSAKLETKPVKLSKLQ